MNFCENMLIYLALLLYSDFGDRKPSIIPHIQENSEMQIQRQMASDIFIMYRNFEPSYLSSHIFFANELCLLCDSCLTLVDFLSNLHTVCAFIVILFPQQKSFKTEYFKSL